jgi:phage recombination protein Bet
MTTTDLARSGERTQAIDKQPEQRGITLSQVRELTGYDLPQIAMIRHNMAVSMGRKPEEVPMYDLALFCHSSKALGLDPLLRQAYWIVREGKGALQVGIDGFRAIADRSGVYAGSEPAVFRGRVEVTHDGKTFSAPEAASVVVWKIVAGHKCPFTGEARWSEFYPGDKQGFMWRKMPFHMLAKVAEGQALRKAFPAQLGSVDMSADVGEEAPHVQVVEQARPATTAADYDRTIGAADWGEKEPARESLPHNVDPEELADALRENSKFVTTGGELNVKGLEALTAEKDWTLKQVLDANTELEQRIKTRNAELDKQAHAESAGQQRAFDA